MSRRNGDKARWSLQRKKRVTQRMETRLRRVEAAQQKPVVKQAKPPKPPKPVPPPAAEPKAVEAAAVPPKAKQPKQPRKPAPPAE